MVVKKTAHSDPVTSGHAAVLGSTIAAIQTALTLAETGVEVSLMTRSSALGWDSIGSRSSSSDRRFVWPLLMRAVSHPRITFHTNTGLNAVESGDGSFSLNLTRYPRYIIEDLCTNCGRCETQCSARITALVNGCKETRTAIHAPSPGNKSIPSAYLIEKKELSPCRLSCPLGINVQGFVSLLANDKTDQALAIINESAPLAGILGRVCRHLCEEKCNRDRIDTPVSIRALHRFAADEAKGGIHYTLKNPDRHSQDRIAIVGSGPAGLTCAWELKRRGYSPTVFESHSVIGGMLATGIPRFRLPKEVREREISAIKDLGVDIRTGITVGRDVNYQYLKERGFKAFFLAIGTQRNNWLGIPGEYLNGVVDCMSLLLTLNLMVDSFVGQHIVIIGDGNTAIDSARTAIRRNRGQVTILSWTVPEEITAADEEVEEALEEGVSIEHCVVPVEILGEGGKVTGIRCRRTRLTEDIMPNGRHRPEAIPDTDFILNADHVVMAIGQSPNADELKIDGLEIDGISGVVRADPLTLQTSLPGVFAGGDCVTGPNNVVEAMADGLRAAESIDRYLQGNDLAEGRSLEPQKAADVDLDMVEAAPYKRAAMPVISKQKRMNSFEETTRGLSARLARREAQRCLNCALCSQCMECTHICELNAVVHDDCARYFELQADAILNFPSSREEEEAAENLKLVPAITFDTQEDITTQLNRAMSLALQTANSIAGRYREGEPAAVAPVQSITPAATLPLQRLPLHNQRTGVFLCRCGGSISETLDFRSIARRLMETTDVACIKEIAQSCTCEGAREIAGQVRQHQLDRIVLAACRCCNLDQACYSCTDRRGKCLQHITGELIQPLNTIVEFVNIREQCAWVHKDNAREATRKAAQMILAGVTRVKLSPAGSIDSIPVFAGVLVIGSTIANMAAARALAARGYQVELIESGDAQGGAERNENYRAMLEQLKKENITVTPWPRELEISGSPGTYRVTRKPKTGPDHFMAGAILIDVEVVNAGSPSLWETTRFNGLLKRLLERKINIAPEENAANDLLHRLTIKDTTGIFLTNNGSSERYDDETLSGLAAAARVASFIDRGTVTPRGAGVVINEQLCRGCGTCGDICPYIEIRDRDNGTTCAFIDSALCLGCGACVASCPTGAITQPAQSNKQIVSTLRALLQQGKSAAEVY